MSSPEAPAEGALIRLARKARGLSVKEAAKLAPIRLGESRWYHIEAGTEGKGKTVVAPDETLAHMAHIVGLTPERLAEVGRDDAAAVLQEIIRQSSPPTSTQSEPREPDRYLQRILELWPQTVEWQRRTVLGVLEQVIREAPDTAGHSGDIEQQRRIG
ncbi:helix-turn-helix domain-containing protein [Nonomuraea sp. NPDC047897]|uniref:helix-turn-helix domain-containing protein n=1 Tax=Nonomuraea sp. NPDC047897 TaxID=3364346 RepID=UPI00372107F9